MTSSPSRTRTHHGRIFVVVVAHWSEMEEIGEETALPPLVRGREGNSSCHAMCGSLATLKFTAHELLGFCFESPSDQNASDVTAECCGS